jgi:hypothetical protein
MLLSHRLHNLIKVHAKDKKKVFPPIFFKNERVWVQAPKSFCIQAKVRALNMLRKSLVLFLNRRIHICLKIAMTMVKIQLLKIFYWLDIDRSFIFYSENRLNSELHETYLSVTNPIHGLTQSAHRDDGREQMT